MSTMWDSFREELVATSMVLVVTVIGSFYVAAVFTQRRSQGTGQPTPTPGVKDQVAEMVKVLGESSGESSQTTEPPSATPEPTMTTTPEPTSNPTAAEVFYGVGGLYDNVHYRLEINSPRLVFDESGSGSRKLVVDMVLYNKDVTEGLEDKITASIVKDGTIIVPDAAMSVSEVKLIKPKEKLTFQAKISLIESTDVKELHFKPEGLPPTIHQLLP